MNKFSTYLTALTVSLAALGGPGCTWGDDKLVLDDSSDTEFEDTGDVGSPDEDGPFGPLPEGSDNPFGSPSDPDEPDLGTDLSEDPFSDGGGDNPFDGPGDPFAGNDEPIDPPVDGVDNPFGTPEDPFGTPEDPFGTPEDPFGTPEDPFGPPEESVPTERFDCTVTQDPAPFSRLSKEPGMKVQGVKAAGVGPECSLACSTLAREEYPGADVKQWIAADGSLHCEVTWLVAITNPSGTCQVTSEAQPQSSYGAPILVEGNRAPYDVAVGTEGFVITGSGSAEACSVACDQWATSLRAQYKVPDCADASRIITLSPGNFQCEAARYVFSAGECK